MQKKTRRKIRKFSRSARLPIAYTILLGVGLALFLSGLHSCSESRDTLVGSGENVVTETR